MVQGSLVGDPLSVSLFVLFCFPFCSSSPMSASVARDRVECFALSASIPFLFFTLHQHLIYHALYLHSVLTPYHPYVLMLIPVLKLDLSQTQSPFSTELHQYPSVIILSWNCQNTRYTSFHPTSNPSVQVSQ